MTITEITKGTTWKLQVSVYRDDDTPEDLTGYAGKMNIVHRYNDFVIAAPTVTITDNVIECELTPDQTKVNRRYFGLWNIAD